MDGPSPLRSPLLPQAFDGSSHLGSVAYARRCPRACRRARARHGASRTSALRQPRTAARGRGAHARGGVCGVLQLSASGGGRALHRRGGCAGDGGAGVHRPAAVPRRRRAPRDDLAPDGDHGGALSVSQQHATRRDADATRSGVVRTGGCLAFQAHDSAVLRGDCGRHDDAHRHEHQPLGGRADGGCGASQPRTLQPDRRRSASGRGGHSVLHPHRPPLASRPWPGWTRCPVARRLPVRDSDLPRLASGGTDGGSGRAPLSGRRVPRPHSHRGRRGHRLARGRLARGRRTAVHRPAGRARPHS